MSKSQEIDMEDMQRFLPYDPNAVTYSDIKKIEEKKAQQTFNGLTKDQIVSYASDPKWVRARWILFGLFWAIWIFMLVAAVLIVVYTPKCAYKPKLNFYEKELVYQLDVEKFKDSNNDLKGDLEGLANELDYFDEIGVKTLLLSDNFLNREKPNEINSLIGSKEDLKNLKSKLNEKDMHLVFDVPIEVYEKNQESVLEWLKEYADGLRLIVSDLNGSYNETIKNLVDNVNKISKEAFKPKFVAVYPFTENHGQTKLIDQSLLNINSDVVSNPSELIKLFKNLYTDSHPNPAFVLGDFRSQRLSEKIKDNSLLNLYHSIALLLKGTPITLYGDEIELNQNDEFMKWNNEINCGFSSSNLSKQSNCDNNVRKKLARGETLPRIYKKLSTLRQEPSFSWGEISFPDHRQQSNLVSFVRKAAGFDGYLVVANTGKSESAVDFRSLFKDLSSQATVEYFYSNNNNFKNDFKFNDTLQLNNIYLKQGELLIAKFSN